MRHFFLDSLIKECRHSRRHNMNNDGKQEYLPHRWYFEKTFVMLTKISTLSGGRESPQEADQNDVAIITAL